MTLKQTDLAKEFAHPDKDRILTYVDLLFSASKSENFEFRQKKALEDAGLNDNADLLHWKDEKVNELVFKYMSYYIFDNRYQQWVTSQILFWNIQRECMQPLKTDIDERAKQVTMLEKIVDLSDKLRIVIDKLQKDIFEGGIEGIAKNDLVKTVTSPEQRVKKN
jgi:hypothetical protein